MLNLDERDASELVLAIGGYYLLSTGRTLSVRQDSSVQQDDAGRPVCGVVVRPAAYQKWFSETYIDVSLRILFVWYALL